MAEGFTKKEVELKATVGTDFYLRDFVAKKVMGAATGRFVLCCFWRWGRPGSLCAGYHGPIVSDLLRVESCLCSKRVGTRAVLKRSAVGRLLEALERLMRSRCVCWQLTAAPSSHAVGSKEISQE